MDVYVIIRTTGDYEDIYRQPILVVSDEDFAKEYVKEKTDGLESIRESYDNYLAEEDKLVSLYNEMTFESNDTTGSAKAAYTFNREMDELNSKYDYIDEDDCYASYRYETIEFVTDKTIILSEKEK